MIDNNHGNLASCHVLHQVFGVAFFFIEIKSDILIIRWWFITVCLFFWLLRHESVWLVVFSAWFIFENVSYCMCRLVFMPLIAASLPAEHIWCLLSFIQSLNHKIIDDLQSYLIHCDGFSLCPLQHYYQHAVRPTFSRLLWSPPKFFFNSFVELHPPSRHIQRHFGS